MRPAASRSSRAAAASRSRDAARASRRQAQRRRRAAAVEAPPPPADATAKPAAAAAAAPAAQPLQVTRGARARHAVRPAAAESAGRRYRRGQCCEAPQLQSPTQAVDIVETQPRRCRRSTPQLPQVAIIACRSCSSSAAEVTLREAPKPLPQVQAQRAAGAPRSQAPAQSLPSVRDDPDAGRVRHCSGARRRRSGTRRPRRPRRAMRRTAAAANPVARQRRAAAPSRARRLRAAARRRPPSRARGRRRNAATTGAHRPAIVPAATPGEQAGPVQRRRHVRACRRASADARRRIATGHGRAGHRQPRSRRHLAQAAAERLQPTTFDKYWAPNETLLAGMGAQGHHASVASRSRARRRSSTAWCRCCSSAAAAASAIRTSRPAGDRAAAAGYPVQAASCRKTTAA